MVLYLELGVLQRAAFECENKKYVDNLQIFLNVLQLKNVLKCLPNTKFAV